ncbi:MAG: response regulator transcription factor [Parasphingorhabdus sp.]
MVLGDLEGKVNATDNMLLLLEAEMCERPISVFLVDDHPIVEAGLRLGFSLNNDFALVGTALNHDAALDQLKSVSPNVIVMDLIIDGDLDFRYIPLYRHAAPNARLVAFSSLAENAYAPKCKAAGTDGFISKSTSPHELVKALQGVLSKKPDVEQTTAEAPKTEKRAFLLDGVRITPRERQVAEGLARGASIQTIATELGVTKKTAAIHRDNLRIKLRCATSNELIALLARNFDRL